MQTTMTFSDFCQTLFSIEQTTLRLQITRHLAELFNKLSGQEIDKACYLLLGRLKPKYENLEFSFAEKMMFRALSEFVKPSDNVIKSDVQLGLIGESTYETRVSEVVQLFKKHGDLGDVAGLIRKGSKTDTRTISQVYDLLLILAKESGAGSQDKKVQAMIVLLEKSDEVTSKYLIRIMLGTLRLGFSDMTLLDALSWAKTGDKSLRKELELAYQVKADIGKIAQIFLTEGLSGLSKVEIELGVPIAPALCQRLKTADEMIEKMGKVFVEPKYDGTRVLIHVKKNGKEWTTRTFTRNLEESSGMFPELKTALEAISATEVILDSEAVGYDPETDKLLPFQQTIQRKRKHDIEETAKKVPLRFFVFDILFKDGESLLRRPLFERKEILEQTIKKGSVFILSPFIVTNEPQVLREYHGKQLASGLEGAVIKQYESEYQPGRRGFSWVKFKEEEGTTGKLSDTIDCVVMGYYKGKGKRTKFGIGAFLVGIYDKKSDSFRTIAKIGTGLTDEQWEEIFTRCSKVVTNSKPHNYFIPDLLIPDVYVTPHIVVEIAADEVTDSPTHTAEKALRFPRLVRFRDDKSPEDSTTLSELTTL